jgi:hypothetical protein
VQEFYDQSTLRVHMSMQREKKPKNEIIRKTDYPNNYTGHLLCTITSHLALIQ